MNDTTPDDATAAQNGPVLPDAERFDAYLEPLEELKRVQAFREVVEERVVQECIRVNKARINEFPLLEIERKSLLDILLRRCADHPGHQHVKGLVADFLAVISKYGKARSTGSADEAAAFLPELGRAEALVIKCVQGAVYASALIKDNFSDAVILHFGESVLHQIEDITEHFEFDESWWTRQLDVFVRERLPAAHAGVVAEEKYAVFREGGFAGVRLPFDAILATFHGTDKAIQKTRVQTAFEALDAEPESQRAAAFLGSFLASGDTPLVAARTSAAVSRHLGRIAAMDTAGLEYAGAGAPDSEQAEARLAFLGAQVVALGVGAALVQTAVGGDVERALRDFDARERRVLLTLAGNFERPRLERIIPLVLEFSYLAFLRHAGRDEGGKLVIRTLRARRAVEAEVAALVGSEEGDLTRIGRRRLFDADPDRPDMLVWKPRTAEEMTGLCAMLQLDEAVAGRIASLWETAPFRVEFLVAVNLEAVAKVTGNPAQRVAEILARFGVGPRRAARPAAAGPAPSDSPSTPPPAGEPNQE